VKAKASRVTTPSARPAAPTAAPSLAGWSPKRPSSRRLSVPAIITAPPATTIAALSTDKVTTSRTLPVVAV